MAHSRIAPNLAGGSVDRDREAPPMMMNRRLRRGVILHERDDG
jgi:hypothetical protein